MTDWIPTLVVCGLLAWEALVERPKARREGYATALSHVEDELLRGSDAVEAIEKLRAENES